MDEKERCAGCYPVSHRCEKSADHQGEHGPLDDGDTNAELLSPTRGDEERIYTKEDAERLCEIAIAASTQRLVEAARKTVYEFYQYYDGPEHSLSCLAEVIDSLDKAIAAPPQQPETVEAVLTAALAWYEDASIADAEDNENLYESVRRYKNARVCVEKEAK